MFFYYYFMQLERFLENSTNYQMPRLHCEQVRLVRKKLKVIYESWRPFNVTRDDRGYYHFGEVAFLHVDLRAMESSVFELPATRLAMFKPVISY